MNPWAFIAIALGVLIIIIGVKGSQHHVTAAFKSKGPTVEQQIKSGQIGVV